MRTVVTGCSHWHTARHVAGFKAAGAVFVGFQDADLVLAERMAGEQGGHAHLSVDRMLDEDRPELVLVFGEPAAMAPAARAAIDRGIPIVAEKPLARTSAEVFELAAAAERKNLHASIAFVNRLGALWSAYDELKANGRLGSLSHIATRAINGPPRRYADWNSGWMLDPGRNGGGGALHNLGIHGVDAFLRLTGAGPEAVRVDGVTLSSRAHGEKIEDYGVALLSAPDGTRGTIEAGYTFPVLASGMTRGGDSAWRIAGSTAYLVEADGEITITYPDGRDETRPSGATYENFAADAMSRLRDGRPSLATIRDCARAVRLLERIYASAREPTI